MARIDFINGLRELGYEPQDLGNNKVSFEYAVRVGKNQGKKLLIGFEVGEDFPMNCPGGPHFQSAGIDGWREPPQNIHASPFGSDWRYWSRPFPDWNRIERTVKNYMSHIQKLLGEQR
jgi:hypothetical protein